MLKRGWLYSVAFMIYLIITLPIYGSVAWADIFDAQAFGNDGVPGFRRKNDDTIIRLNATPMTGDHAVLGSQIRLAQDSNRLFMCNLHNNITHEYSCSSLIPGPANPGAQILMLQMLPIGGGAPQTWPLELLVDERAPIVSQSDLKLKGGMVTVNYTVLDRACDACSNDDCAGIKEIRFTSNGVPMHAEYIESAGNCSMVGSTNFTVVVTGTENRTLCTQVHDYLGQIAEKCEEVTIDMKTPTVTNINFSKSDGKVGYIRDSPITGVSMIVTINEDTGLTANKLSADLSALNENPSYKETYKNVAPSFCIPKEESYDCHWTNLMIFITESNPSVTIFLEDDSGNEANQTLIANLLVDVIPPVVQSISTGNVDSHGQVWAGWIGNTITVSMKEDESGFSKKKIALDFSSWGGQLVTDSSSSNYLLRPNNCTPSWFCTWENIIISDVPLSDTNPDDRNSRTRFNLGSRKATKYLLGHPNIDIKTDQGMADAIQDSLLDPGTFDPDSIQQTSSQSSPPPNSEAHNNIWNNMFSTQEIFTRVLGAPPVPSGSLLPISIVFPSGDDAGNLATGLTQTGIWFDGTVPLIENHALTYPCPTSEEQFEWVLNVFDEHSGEPSITYDTSAISLGAGNRTEACVEGADPDHWTCRLIIDNLPSYGIDDADIPFTLRDLAGNTITSSYMEVVGHPARICEIVEGAPPNLITIKNVKIISPAEDEYGNPAIDRKVASITDFPLFFDIELDWDGYPETYNIEILETQVTGCTVEMGLVEDAYNLMDFNTSHPFIGERVLISESALNGTDLTEIDELKVNCNLSFKVRYGTYVYRETEVDSFPDPTMVKLTDSPIAFINDTILDKLDDIKDEYDLTQKTIDDLTILNYIFGTICTIVTFAVTLFGAIVILKLAILIIAQVPWFENIWKMAPILSKIQGLIGRWLWNPPGYGIIYPSLGTLFRVMCAFYTCKMSDATKLLNFIPMVMSFGQGFALGIGDADFLEEGTISSGSNNYDSFDLNYDGFYGKDELGAGDTQDSLDGTGTTELTYNFDDNTVTAPSDTNGSSMAEDGVSDKPNAAAAVFGFDQYSFDPYKSIYSAVGTLCVPMIIYNLEKLQQIRCLEFRCIVNRVKAGFDSSICEEQRTIRECLYYTGAVYKMVDNADALAAMKMIIGVWFGETTVMAFAFANKAACGAAIKATDIPLTIGVSKMKAQFYSLTALELVLGSIINPLTFIWMPIRSIFNPTLFFEVDFLYAGAELADTSFAYGLPPSTSADVRAAEFAVWGACDLLAAVTFVTDTGDWLYFKGSWDVTKLYDHLEKPDYCSGIEDLT